MRTSNNLSSTCQVSVPRATQTITFPAIANQFTTSPTLSLTDAAAATSSSGLPVTYSVVSGPATLNGTTLTLTGAGTVTVRADQPGNATYAPANSVDRSFIVSGVVAQTITFPAIANQLMSSPTLSLTGAAAATSSSGLPVTYSVVSGPATLNDTTLTLTGAGTVTVRAIQNGNATYAPAISVDQSFTVSRVAQTITFPAIANQLTSNPTVSLIGAAAATSSSGLPVTYSVVNGPATLNGTTLTLTGIGTVTVRAIQNGNATYAPASSMDQSFIVSYSGPQVTQVNAGGWHSLFLKSDGSVWAAGSNGSGRLGDGTTTNRSTPTQVMSGVASISAGGWHSLFLKNDGSVWAAGSNGSGRLGDGTTTDRSTPVQVMSGVASISAGYGHSLFLKSDGSIWATGSNGSGQLGDSTTTSRSTPVQVMSGVASISAGYYHSLFLKSDGSVWASGNNGSGRFGDGTTTSRSTPVQVMSGVASISAGKAHSLFLKNDGTVWATGSNGSGQLGDGTTTSRSTPVQVMSGVASISAGYDHSLFLKSDGTVWASGTNSSGQLGDGTTTSRSTPVQVMSGVASISAGGYHSLFLKSDGSIWASGTNGYGQLGDGTMTNRSTPVMIYPPISGGVIAQTITFGSLSDKTYGDAPFAVSATASSGLAPTFSIISGPATISGNMITLTGTGTVVVRAAQAGNGTFAAAPTVDQTFTVTSDGSASGGYASWINSYPGLADATASGDPDHDGIPNLLKYVLNGNPGVASTAILPAVSKVANNFVFTFSRRVASAQDTTQIFQYSSDLSHWTDVNITGTKGAEVTLGTTDGDGAQSVTVTIPQAAGTIMFGRLKVSQP